MDFYDLSFNLSNGEKVNLSDFKGKTILIVNTATQCRFTPQFEGLEKLHQKYKNKGLVVLGFPCNQFLSQEPLSNEDMQNSCKLNHGVTFQLSEKIDVNGNNTHPIFNYLKSELGRWYGNKIKWNFTKFLVDKTGHPTKRFNSFSQPAAIEKEIIKIL